MKSLAGKIAWITGAGSGIGEAATLALSSAGAAVVLTGRRVEPLDQLAHKIHAAGGEALVAPGDMSLPETATAIAAQIASWKGRLDVFVGNAGGNIKERRWDQLTPAGIDTVLNVNLSSAFYGAAAALSLMRPNKDGVLIHTASWAGRFWGSVSGTAYSAAKTAVIAMSHGINMEEYGNGIRSTAVMPAEVATPILNSRPVPPSEEVRATMLQPVDLGELILFIATRPRHVCINEVTISPTANRMFSI